MLLSRQRESQADRAGTDGVQTERKMCVLVANEPRLYREAIAASLRGLEPDIEVLLVEPETLDLRVESATPDLVFCNRATPCMMEKVPVWAEVYPEEEPVLAVSINVGPTRLTAVEDNGLANLLWIVEQARLLYQRRT